MLPGPTLAAVLIWAQVALGQYTMTSRWGAAVAVLPSPPAIVIQGGKVDPSGAYSYSSAPNTADMILLPLGKGFDAASPPYTLIDGDKPGPAVAWHCLAPLGAVDGVWTLLSFGGDGGWAGQVSDTSSAWLIRINPTDGKVDNVPQMSGWGNQPTRRVRHSCAAPPGGGKVYITGGQATDGSAIYDNVFVFDPAAQVFTALPALPEKLYHHTSVLLSNGTLVVLGGAIAKKDSNTDLQPLDRVFTLDTTSEAATWATLKTSGMKPAPRNGATAVLVSNDNIFVFGGVDKGGNNVMNDGWVFSPASLTWTEAFDGKNNVEGRYDHVAASAGGDQVVVVGGYGKNSPVAAGAVLLSAVLAANGDVSTTPSTSYTPAEVAGAGAAAVMGTSGNVGANANAGSNNIGGDSGGSPSGTFAPAASTHDPSIPTPTDGRKPDASELTTGHTATLPDGSIQTGDALAARSDNTAKIIGLSVGIIGGLLAVALAVLLFFLLRRRKRRGHQFSEKQEGGQHLIGSEGDPPPSGLQRKPTIGELLRGGAAGLARALSTRNSGGRYEPMRRNRAPTIFPARTTSAADSYGNPPPAAATRNIMYASSAELAMGPGHSRTASGTTGTLTDASGEYPQIVYNAPLDDSVGRSTATTGWLASDEASASAYDESRYASNSAVNLSRPITPGSAGPVAGAALGAATVVAGAAGAAALARSLRRNKSLPPSPAGTSSGSRPLPALPAAVALSPIHRSASKNRHVAGASRGSPNGVSLTRKASVHSRRSSKASMQNPFEDGDVASPSRRSSVRAGSSAPPSALPSALPSSDDGDIGLARRQPQDPFVDPAEDVMQQHKFSRSGARLAGLSGEFGAALSRTASLGVSSVASHRTFGIADFGTGELDLSLTDFAPPKAPSRPESPIHSACLDAVGRATSPPPSPSPSPLDTHDAEPLLRGASSAPEGLLGTSGAALLRPISSDSGSASCPDSPVEAASIELAMRAVSPVLAPTVAPASSVKRVLSPASPLSINTHGLWSDALVSPLSSPTLAKGLVTPKVLTGGIDTPTPRTDPSAAEGVEELVPLPAASGARTVPTTPAKTAPSTPTPAATPGTTPRGTPRGTPRDTPRGTPRHRSLKSMPSLGSIQSASTVPLGASVRDKVHYFESRADGAGPAAGDAASIVSSTPSRTLRKQTSFDP